MNNRKLAVQMYTLRDYCRTADAFAKTCAKVRRIGYRAVQLSGVEAVQGKSPELGPKQARKVLDDNGLRCIATHRSWDDLSNRTAAEIEFHLELGCDYTAIGMMPSEFGVSEEGFVRFVDSSARVSEELGRHGIRFGYHNHSHEFVRIGPGQRTVYDVLIERGGPKLQLEVDVYWAAHAGLSPATLLNRCAGRIAVVHAKDMEVVPGAGPVMAPVGEGNLDWKSILSACEAGGTEWYAVEQDTCRRDPFDCLKSSIEFLGDQLTSILANQTR